MTFEGAAIPQRVADSIKSSIKSGNLPHGFLFETGGNTNRNLIAKDIAKRILCQEKNGVGCGTCAICRKIDNEYHEDVYFAPLSEKGSIGVDTIAELQSRLRKKPLSGDRNIAVIPQAEAMTTQAQNKLLKVLEEPPGNSVLLLLTGNTETLASTVRSRCVIHRTGDSDAGINEEWMDLADKVVLDLLDRQPFYQVVPVMEELFKDKNGTEEFLNAMEYTYRNIMVRKHPHFRDFSKEYAVKAIKSIEESKKILKYNVSPGVVLKRLILIIGG